MTEQTNSCNGIYNISIYSSIPLSMFHCKAHSNVDSVSTHTSFPPSPTVGVV